jgi:hypothetical protein
MKLTRLVHAYFCLPPMIPQKLTVLYNNLQRGFNAQPSSLSECGALLQQLKVRVAATDPWYMELIHGRWD